MGVVYMFFCFGVVSGAILMASIGIAIASQLGKPKWAGAIIGALIGILLVSFWLWWTYEIKPAQAYRKQREQSGEAYSLYNIGAEYDEKGQYDQALDYYNQALNMHRELDNRWAEGKTLYSIGAVYEKMGHIDQALDYYKQALVFHREVGDSIGERKTLEAIESLPAP